VGIDYLSLRVRELVLAGKPVANVVAGATRQPSGRWIANLASDHVSGAVAWWPGVAAQPAAAGRLSARLARLSIPDSQETDVAQFFDAPPAEMPALDLVADDFEIGGHSLGHLELAASNAGGAWQLRKLQIVNPDGRMAATGAWTREAAGPAHRMRLELALDFEDAGRLLTRLGLPGTVRGGAGRLEGGIGWRGSPFAIDYPSLAGNLKLAVQRGQFLKVDPGSGRLLGVMSLQALPRRIALDFRDIFTEGFAFDSISATARLEAGTLATTDFKMRGLAATVLIEGQANLQAETQSLRVLVLPDVNAGSASLVYALLANPAVGLGTFLAQMLLRDPLSKAFSFGYDVSGSWADPQVRRLERPRPDARPDRASP
jgi:uncharacterized protein YhdP